RLGGSLVWGELLYALAAGMQGVSSATRLEIASELLDAAQDAQACCPARVLRQALTCWAWSMVAVGREEEGRARVIDCYRGARVTGRSGNALRACLWLAEFAWRENQAQNALQWIDAAQRLTDAAEQPGVVAEVSLHQIVVAVLQGDLALATHTFVKIPAATLAAWAGEAFHQAVEAGALLARAGGLQHIAGALTRALDALPDPRNDLAIVRAFRREQLGLDESAAEAPHTTVGVDSVVAKARSDLATLHEYLRRSRRR
ncbi:MAG TPA: hypothetical protein VF457_01130, partial [Burkholderiaceae bacterium]